MSRKVVDLEAKLLLGPRDRRAEKELGVGKARYYILYNFCIIYIVYILYYIYGGFHSHGVPQARWILFIYHGRSQRKMNDLGLHDLGTSIWNKPIEWGRTPGVSNTNLGHF